MKALIVEDEATSRLLLAHALKAYGETCQAVTGTEAVECFSRALEEGKPFNLVCLDIMLPKMDGQQVLRELRALEEKRGIDSSKGAKIVMTTVHHDVKNIWGAYSKLCDGYLVKPIEKGQLLDTLRRLELIS